MALIVACLPTCCPLVRACRLTPPRNLQLLCARATGYGCYGTVGQGGGFGGFTWHRDEAPGTKVEKGYDGKGWSVYFRDQQIPPLHESTIAGLRKYYGNACGFMCEGDHAPIRPDNPYFLQLRQHW